MAIILLATIFKTHVGTTKIALYFDIVENGTRQEAKYNAVLIIFVLYYFFKIVPNKIMDNNNTSSNKTYIPVLCI